MEPGIWGLPRQYHGNHTIPLFYVVRKEVTVPVHAPPLVPGQPHPEDHGSMEADIVARESHTHALYRDEIYLVYYKLEEANRSTPYTDRWDLPFLRYHKIMVIYPYPLLVVITPLFSCIIFINDCICILNGSPG